MAERRDLQLSHRDKTTPVDFWDSARVSKLRRLWDEGFSCDYITREIGAKSKQVVVNRITVEVRNGRLKSRHKHLTSDEQGKVVRMYKAGVSINQIAKEMRFTVAGIKAVIKREREKEHEGENSK